jgi:membrane fusion protein (multidrug efflux system)
MAKKLGTLIIFILIAAFIWLGYGYLRHRQLYAVSNAGFIKSDRLATLSFKVPGKVTQMLAHENQVVSQGEILAQIDPVDFVNGKTQAVHQREALTAQLEAQELKHTRVAKVFTLQAQIAQTDIDAASRQIDATHSLQNAANVKLAKLAKDAKRYEGMLSKHLISEGDYETIKAQLDATRDQVEAQTMQLRAQEAQKAKATKAHELSIVSEKEIQELEKAMKATRAQIKALDATIAGLDNKIAYATLKAPFGGVIARRFVTAPRVVGAGSPIYALIDPEALYAEVLLSEKKLHGIHTGSRVEITVDALEEKAIEGEVASIASASASTFSLVPRDIASGEFTKLDQRFVIRIHLKDKADLRAGMSIAVAIERGE